MWIFKDDNGNLYNEAYLDGYEVADRLLEQCYFKITIDSNNKFHATIADPGNLYYRGLDIPYWTSMMEQHASEQDIFMRSTSLANQEDLFVFDTVTNTEQPHL
jgi:hypothetical protein